MSIFLDNSMVDDIYFLPEYARLYEKVESGTTIEYEYNSSLGTIKNLFIKREIPIKIGKDKWYDITTPYGYGGPRIIVLQDQSKKEELINQYANAFRKYCEENYIVSEFVRFHPLVGNGLEFSSIYNSEHIRNTLGTNLIDYQDPIASEYSKGCRKSIRQAIRNGITWRITPHPDNIDTFIEIYNSTMDRNHAADYYYFGSDYFHEILRTLNKNLLYVEAIYNYKTIAAGLYFTFGKIIHIHLSGTLSEYLFLSPAYVLRYATTLWGIENGYEIIHHGGGRSNTEDDSLYKFKKQFAKNTEFKFYIGKKIWNKKIYEQLCDKDYVNSTFFPAYRERI